MSVHPGRGLQSFGESELLAGFHGWLIQWAPAADWGVAIGTASLALATMLLAIHAKREARAVAEEADLVKQSLAFQQDQARAALRPYVYPSAPAAWSDGTGPYAGRWQEVLPTRNSGPGIALNVRGHVMIDAAEIRLTQATLGPAETFDLRLEWQGFSQTEGWLDAKGSLFYEDAVGRRWRTDFVVRGSERRTFEIVSVDIDVVRPNDRDPDA
jgi:hypothetical protein